MTAPLRAPTSDRIRSLLAGLAERRPKTIDLGLTRIIGALDRLGSPHKKLPPVIHVAGTNGKGSTIAFMQAILQAAGLRVHVYTSPHLVAFNERIVLANQMITDEELARVLGKCEAAAGDMELTYFEAVTAAAFLAFAETPADALLLETGLGGRLDATNVVDEPLAAVITPIGFDHQDWLGDTIEKIAGEKAGIIKKGRPVVTGSQRAEALQVIETRALALGAELHAAGQDWHISVDHGRLVWQDEDTLSDVSLPRLFGNHQVENAGLAIAALKVAGLCPDDEKVSMGLEQAFWPARLQRLTTGPLIDKARAMAHEDVEIWLDGGHNPHAAKVLARALADLEEIQSRPLILISGMQKNKDAAGFFAPFADLAAMVFTVAAPTDNALSAADLALEAQGAGLPAEAAPSVSAALDQALSAAFRSQEGQPRILICGSLYLAGDILQENG